MVDGMDAAALLDGLNDAQRQAVTSDAAPLVILAGAGSGKTRVLTRRIAYRCATETADPRHVVALTFTRKAAGELGNRLRSRTPSCDVRGPTDTSHRRPCWSARPPSSPGCSGVARA